IGAPGRSRQILPDPDLLPSRRAARASIREAIARTRGPVALTGEPGAGKTALWRSLQAEREAGESWLAVEVTPGLGPRDLYRLIAHGLRVKPDWFGRPELLDTLAYRSLDGERWTLVVDEAQNLDPATLEEVRVLSNRLGEPDGFAAILLVGQTPLARRLLGSEGRAVAARLAGHVHLRPLDVEEVGLLLQAAAPGQEWPEELVDRIHLEARGRPGPVMDRALRTEPRPTVATPATSPRPALAAAPARSAPLMGPARPPIRVEEGLIEVGWTPESEAAAPEIEESPVPPAAPNGDGERRIDDPYAALQAWQEWATNQGRQPAIEPAAPAGPSPTRRDEESLAAAAPARVWADEEHGFAPFGRLFTRASQENEAE
ncbi:MAG TPA: AAA family ATPase, partial [Isosphaeraceae bacterium]